MPSDNRRERWRISFASTSRAWAVSSQSPSRQESRARTTGNALETLASTSPRTARCRCPDATEVATAANRVLGRDRVRADDAGTGDAGLRLAVSFSREAAGFGVRVRETGALDAERAIHTTARTCSALTSVLGATVAMMIDAADQSRDSAARASALPPNEAAAPTRTSQGPSTPPPSASSTDRAIQAPKRRTAFDGVFLEAFGNGVYDSLNYERIIEDGTFALSVRVGFGYAPLSICGGPRQSACSLLSSPSDFHAVSEFAAPVLANAYWGSASHKIEVGLGITGIYRTDAVAGGTRSGAVDGSFSKGSKGFDVAGTALVGYRFIPAHGGLSFGGGFTPLFGAGGFLASLSFNVGAEFL